MIPVTYEIKEQHAWQSEILRFLGPFPDWDDDPTTCFKITSIMREKYHPENEWDIHVRLFHLNEGEDRQFKERLRLGSDLVIANRMFEKYLNYSQATELSYIEEALF